ncbi:hypothetical protein GCM10009347_25360 [Shewanella algicola]|uniref:Glycosyltransferase family 2 protein n=1 Tax=Shewanella algicola TaxID=640633 RepID=A0A9X2CE78_9GAMM|nr:glycosyltransferase family A protein [Shewanella algicola]MCL1106151.1 glycosyltransferase family 2 protein [Shewanella algicola]GGP57848.1 hypothetical protein GCM10009347_25360 [Shewanella algicola]
MKNKCAIIIPAFSRAKSLERLLKSLSSLDFTDDYFEIIISLDGGASDDVLLVADNFKRNFEIIDVSVIKRTKNLGLRNHILWCGDLTEKYNSVVILEDDLVISKNFILYIKNAISKYKGVTDIAGISLYSPKYNEYANLPFEACENGYSNYFMKVASSWGQIWTFEQWSEFKKWYTSNSMFNLQDRHDIPVQLANWPSSSWKKYYSTYLVDTNKYFVYPYSSISSNCADSGGTHNTTGTSILQVPIPEQFNSLPDFQDFNENATCYDQFMEREQCSLEVNGKITPVELDIYGLKPINYLQLFDYTVTSKYSSDPLSKIKLMFKPIENNISFLTEYSQDNNEVLSLSNSKHIYEPTWFSLRVSRFKLARFLNYVVITNKSYYVFLMLHILKVFK